jgi:hypothetical protein
MLFIEGMGLDERLGFAHLAYRRALALAQARSTPMSWRRLLTAAKNLRAATRERARAVPAARWLAGPAVGWPPPAGASSVPAPGGSGPGALVIPIGPRAAPGPRTVSRGPVWAEVRAEWERARALMEASGRLLAESRALCSTVRELAAARAAPWGATPA